MDDEQRRDQYQQTSQDNQSQQPGGVPPDETRATETPVPVESKPSNKKKIAIVVTLVVILLAIVGAVWAYVMTNSPQNTLKRAMYNLSQQKAIAADFVVAPTENVSEEPINGDFSFKTDSDNEKNYELTGGISEGEARIGLNFRSVDETYYIQATGLGEIGAFATDETQRAGLEDPLVQSYITSINDQWFTFSPESVGELLTDNESFDPNAQLSDEDIRKIEDLYNKNQFINIEERNGAVIDEVDTRHFVLQFNHEQLLAFAKDLKDADIAAIPITDEDIKSLEDQKQETEDARVEVWIADEDTFKQVQLYDVNKPEETVTITLRDTEATEINVVAPESAEDITLLLQLLLAGSVDASMPPTTETSNPAVFQ